MMLSTVYADDLWSSARGKADSGSPLTLRLFSPVALALSTADWYISFPLFLVNDCEGLWVHPKVPSES